MNLKRMELPPPTCYMKILVTKQIEDAFQKVNQALEDSLNVLEDQKALTLESYILFRMVYKMNNKWRREKSLQALKRVQTCLKRYKEINIITYIQELREHFKGCNLYIGEIYLPTQQMIKYLLRQIMCIACLMSQTCNYCQYAYICISQLLAIGNFIPQNMIFLSTISRIWTLSKSLVLHSAEWYEKIREYFDVFPQTQVQDLGEDDLPKNLKSVLNFENEAINKSPDPAYMENSEEFIDLDSEESDNDSDMETIDEAEKLPDKKIDLSDTLLEDIDKVLTTPKNNTKHKQKKNEISVSNVISSDNVDDVCIAVPRQDLQSHNYRKDTQNRVECIVDDEDAEDIGLVVSREELHNQTSVKDTEEFNVDQFKQEINISNTFKKLKVLLNQLENASDETDQCTLCKKRFKLLKKEYLNHKRNGKKNDTFIQQAKDELRKLADTIVMDTQTEISDILESESVGNYTKCTENVVLDSEKSKNYDFDMEEIFRKPFKSLNDIIEKHHGGDIRKRKERKQRLKQCALKIKLLRKRYMEGNKKKQCIKEARKEVIALLDITS